MTIEHGENRYNKYGQPTLDLVFTGDKKSLNDRVGNVAVEFTRTQDTQASYYKSDGTIGYASTDVARFDHDPMTGECRGLLIEESRTNSITYSFDLGNTGTGGWYTNANKGGLNGSSTKNYFVTQSNTTDTLAPDGTYTATKLSAPGTIIDPTATPGINPSSKPIHLVSKVTAPDGVSSFYIKDPSNFANGLDKIGIMSGGLFNPAKGLASFDLVNNQVNTANTASDARIEDVGNGWYRISCVTGEGGSWAFNAWNALTSDLYIWGAQCESGGSFPTSYIPTSDATATRGSDQALLNGTDVTSWYNITEGTVYSEAMSPLDLNTTRLVWHFRDPGRKEHNAVTGFQWYDVGTGYSTNGITYVAGVFNKQAYAYSHITGSSTRACLNGEFRYDLPVNPSATPSAHTTLSLGSNVGTNIFLNGYIKQFTYWSTRLSDSDIQGLTE